MDNCIFCQILSGKLPSHKIYEDDIVMAFLDIAPSSPGHTVVIPKRHVSNFFDLSREEISDFCERSLKIARQIKQSSLSPDGLNMGVNHGKAAGQMVDHLHFHIIPRWKDDQGSDIQSVTKNPPKQSLEKILAQIKSK